MAAPSLPVDWQSIRRCAELGVPLKDIAAKFGIQYEAVKKRSQREQWLTPAKIEQARAAVAPAPAQPGLVPPSSLPPSKEAPDSSAIVAGTIAEMGAQLQTTVLSKTLAALRKADLASLPINSWQDAKLATEVGLKVAGLESSQGPAVSLVFTGTGDLPPLVEIDAVSKPITGENEQLSADLL